MVLFSSTHCKAKQLLCCCLLFLHFQVLQAQTLRPGFDKEEFRGLMHISAQFGDSAYRTPLPPPAGYRRVYVSPVVGLDNKWELWMTNRNVPVLSIRGTTQNAISWTANFYAAMVPATGILQLSASNRFAYHLADNPRATVHTGWLVSTAFLVQDMLPKIDSLQKAGHREMYIMGFSQGGVIAYLLTAYLLNQQKNGAVSPAIRFKTYCGAAPKPGNLYFAYDYEAATQGWSYTVVNSADWVPETPISVQTLSDFNKVNPFVNAKSIIRQQSFIKRLALNYAYGKLKNPTQKAANNYRKYLGRFIAKTVKNHLPGFVEPAYAATIDYVRTGTMIPLIADEEYFKKFPQDEKQTFVNHFHAAYLYLLDKLPMENTIATSTPSPLDGNWTLTAVADADVAGLYADRKPEIRFEDNRAVGSTGCNRFSAPVQMNGRNVSFSQNMVMTKMACPGNGEQLFLEALKKVNGYRIENNRLLLVSNEVVMMEFNRQ